MEIGISLACFYPEHPETVVSRVAEMGFKTAELFINTISETKPEYISEISKECEKHNIEIYSVHPFTSALENYMFFSPYDRRVEDSKKLYERYCEVACFLGAKVINIHGDRGIGLKDFDLYCNCLLPFFELSEKYDVKFAHENVFFNSVNHPEFTQKLCERFGEDIKFTFDIKQANKGGSVPIEVCEAMGKNIVNFHINDYDEDNICLLPGEGITDYKSIFNVLKKNDYTGPAIIEVYRNNFTDTDQIIKSRDYLERI